jgi:uncharacterized alkaline shock family protein YloU
LKGGNYLKTILKNNLGDVEVSKEVIALIAGNAAMECYGLVGMASRKMSDGITELLGKDNLGKGVEIHVDGDAFSVDLYIIVQYGTKISEVANNIIEKVYFTLGNLLGVNPDKVNVIVHGVRLK